MARVCHGIVSYRVSTRFNWYADPVAQLLLTNLASINLDFYKHRSELLARPEHS